MTKLTFNKGAELHRYYKLKNTIIIIFVFLLLSRIIMLLIATSSNIHDSLFVIFLWHICSWDVLGKYSYVCLHKTLCFTIHDLWFIYFCLKAISQSYLASMKYENRTNALNRVLGWRYSRWRLILVWCRQHIHESDILHPTNPGHLYICIHLYDDWCISITQYGNFLKSHLLYIYIYI